jgi:integral membrane sensor domain MASE1
MTWHQKDRLENGFYFFVVSPLIGALVLAVVASMA